MIVEKWGNDAVVFLKVKAKYFLDVCPAFFGIFNYRGSWIRSSWLAMRLKVAGNEAATFGHIFFLYSKTPDWNRYIPFAIACMGQILTEQPVVFQLFLRLT
ncbi:hypothetical protein DSUL_50022 [Desulfovibrionales bacterium]